jgi:hypothetical protein
VRRGDVFRLRLGRCRGHEQAGVRDGVVVRSDALLRLSTLLIAPTPTPTAARGASFRPEIEVDGTPHACSSSRPARSTSADSATVAATSRPRNGGGRPRPRDGPGPAVTRTHRLHPPVVAAAAGNGSRSIFRGGRGPARPGLWGPPRCCDTPACRRPRDGRSPPTDVSRHDDRRESADARTCSTAEGRGGAQRLHLGRRRADLLSTRSPGAACVRAVSSVHRRDAPQRRGVTRGL